MKISKILKTPNKFPSFVWSKCLREENQVYIIVYYFMRYFFFFFFIKEEN